jgi:hypothetical protein
MAHATARKLKGLLSGRRFGAVYAGSFLEVAKLARPEDVTIGPRVLE